MGPLKHTAAITGRERRRCRDATDTIAFSFATRVNA
jgi:hypothetical protein